jgi:hypothetical protein
MKQKICIAIDSGVVPAFFSAAKDVGRCGDAYCAKSIKIQIFSVGTRIVAFAKGQESGGIQALALI